MECIRCDQAGVQEILNWAAREGWNPGKQDAATFFATDPQGFWIGVQDGRPLASISVTSWNSTFAFVGLYIVLPEERGKGYGWQLWQHALGQHSDKCLALDGVVAQQANYARSGFKLAHRSLRWQGHAGQLGFRGGDFVEVHAHNGIDRSFAQAKKIDDSSFARALFPKLLALDSAVSPSDRPAYLEAWLHQSEARALASADGSALAVARPCQNGWKIAPLIAHDAAQAEALMAACCEGMPDDTPIFVDAPEPNQSAQSMFKKLGFTVGFEVARMYTRPVREHRLDWLFGVTSFELG